MKLEKSPAELERTFDDAFPDDPRAQRRKMFGFPSGVVNGNMFGGLFEQDMILRLSDADRQTLTAQYGAAPFEPMGRSMKGYVTVPAAILADKTQLRDWVQRAFEYAASLPAKEKKAPAGKKSAH